MKSRHRTLSGLILLICAGVAVADAPTATVELNDPERQRAFDLYREHRMPEAAPLLERVVARFPNDTAAHEALGVALVSEAETQSDPARAREDRIMARREFLRAQELGDTSDICKYMVAELPTDGSASATADTGASGAALSRGEDAFARGDWRGAITAYTAALELDPHNARAALFLGDTYFNLKDMDRAGEWFARAISIDPDRETPYRYWGDALMAQGKMVDARRKYIEGIAAEPYATASFGGLRKWLAHFQLSLNTIPIPIPAPAKRDEKGQVSISVDSAMLQNSDTSAAWLVYSIARAAWPNEKFAKSFPKEKAYRHTLLEESTALATTVVVYRELLEKKPKKRDASLELLGQLYDEHLLEPFILLLHADDELAQDYPAYRSAHRDQLTEFLDRYLVPSAP